ncbi:MAG TPA: DUF4936 family protein [Ideonella sp.]|uniref:DUF4936 family protein n=1 Tax=Ideonella sp. TaxID=1929293 RepID=UPI002CE8C001|nr:DUF4936 family protein [Ideonella sp.]HSI51225.1 DUF4936 family protein [Ideonella sp.]
MKAEPGAAGAPPAWFIYYRVLETGLATASALVHAFQQRLRSDWPGLSTEVMRRPEASDGCVTLMEVYRLPAQASAADAAGLPQAIEAAASVLAPHLAGPRHTECFVPCA